MAEQFNKPAWNIFSHQKLQIQGEAWDKTNPRQRPTLTVHVYSNNPRFRVYMNDGKVQKPIAFTMDMDIFSSMMTAIESIANTTPHVPKVISFPLKGYRDHNGRQLDKIAVTTTVTIGRDNDNAMFIALQAKGEQPAKFVFMPGYYSDMIGGDGERLSAPEASTYQAIGWARRCFKLVTDYISIHAKEVKKQTPQNNGGGNSGGYQNNNQSNQSSNPPVDNGMSSDVNW